MKKLIAVLFCIAALSVQANQTCYTSADGITICSNSNGSWG